MSIFFLLYIIYATYSTLRTYKDDKYGEVPVFIFALLFWIMPFIDAAVAISICIDWFENKFLKLDNYDEFKVMYWRHIEYEEE